MENIMTIGQVANRLGISAGALRYYERVGLLPHPPRTGAGYRLYGEDALRRLRLVKGARRLGLSLKEMRQLIEYALDSTCVNVRHRLRDQVTQKMAEIDRGILELTTLKAVLQSVSRRLEKEAAMTGADQTWATCQPCACTDEQGPS